jgi:predicted site-specific integrase-resolvase
MNLLPKEAADRLRVSTGTLANWRVAGEGPRFMKFGRRVLYPEREIEAFEDRCLRTNTTQGTYDR